MELPTHELQAFRTVAAVLNFSAAAERIHITQSALSQRIQSLERRLGLTLFVRGRKTVKLTEAGIRLLRYCQAKEHLETEMLHDLVSAATGKLAGYVRVAGFSSVLHSVVMPALAPLLRDNPAVQFEFSMHEMEHLPDILLRGEADFVIIDHHHQTNNIKTHALGSERYVLVQNKNYPDAEIYLDHDPNDQFTKLFFKANDKKINKLVRSYVDDIEGVIKGIELGIGQGIVPTHLLHKSNNFRIVKDAKAMEIPVVLHYFQQPYYSKLQQAVVDALTKNCKKFLAD